MSMSDAGGVASTKAADRLDWRRRCCETTNGPPRPKIDSTTPSEVAIPSGAGRGGVRNGPGGVSGPWVGADRNGRLSVGATCTSKSSCLSGAVHKRRRSARSRVGFADAAGAAVAMGAEGRRGAQRGAGGRKRDRRSDVRWSPMSCRALESARPWTWCAPVLTLHSGAPVNTPFPVSSSRPGWRAYSWRWWIGLATGM